MSGQSRYVRRRVCWSCPDKSRRDDVAEVVRASREHGGEGVPPVVLFGNDVRGLGTLADGCANFVPDGRAAKMRKLAGEYEIDDERHFDKPRAGADVSCVGSCIISPRGNRLRNHAQRFVPCRQIHVVGGEAGKRGVIIVAQFGKLHAEVECCAILLELLMLKLVDRFRIVNALENVVGGERG